MAYNVEDVANALLQLAYNSEGAEDLMSNMKLQKMLYYQQGYHLAYFGTPLFNEDIEAWQYGPVVPSIYEKFSANGRNGIMPEAKSFEFESEEEMNLFFKVYETYGQYSAYGLMELTHKETPWIKAKRPLGHGRIISKDIIKAYFSKRINTNGSKKEM